MKREFEVRLVVRPWDRDLEGNITEAEVDIDVKGVPTDVVEFLDSLIEAALETKHFDGEGISINDNEGEWAVERWRVWKR